MKKLLITVLSLLVLYVSYLSVSLLKNINTKEFLVDLTDGTVCVKDYQDYWSCRSMFIFELN